MPADVLDPVLKDAIQEEIDQILRQRGGVTYTAEDQDRLDSLEGQVQNLLHEPNVGRSMTGPLWLSGASVLDGTIVAEKLSVTELDAVNTNTGALQVSDSITAASSYPALTGERIVITSTAITGYNASDDKTFVLNTDGSGHIGQGGSQVSWDTAGVVTVPSAAISALTIADVGSGTFDSNFDAGTGRVRAGTALQRVELTSGGLSAYDTGGTETFKLDSSDGSLSHTGTHTIRSASSGARVEMASVGIRGFNSSGVQTFGVNSSDGSGFLGTGSVVTWSSTGTVQINGSVLVSGSVTADRLNVTELSAVSSDMGTITAGSITAGSIKADTIDSGTLDGTLLGLQSVITDAIDDLAITTAKLDNGAVTNLKVSDLSADKITTGTITSEVVTLGTGGKLEWEGGASFIDSGGMVLNSEGVVGDAIQFVHNDAEAGGLYADTDGFHIRGSYGSSAHSHLHLETGYWALVQNNGGAIEGASDAVEIQHGGLGNSQFDSSGRFVPKGAVYPSGQTSRGIADNGTSLVIDGDWRVNGGDVYLGATSGNEWRIQRETGGTQNIIYLRYNTELGMRLTRQGADDFDLEVMVGGSWTKIAG